MSVEQRFRSRFNDVALYLQSLKSLEKNYSKPGKSFYRPSEALAASRAAAFIMIYNAVEFAIREAIVEVRNDIVNSRSAYIDLLSCWREEIVRAHFRERLEQGTEYTKLLRDFSSFVPGKVEWRGRIREIPFSGNINHELLIKFADKIGERWRPPKTCLGGSDLELVKVTRNQLAHGEESFESVGGHYSTDDLIKIIPRIRKFVCSYVKMLERYKVRQRYRVKQSVVVSSNAPNLSQSPVA